jgi:hypothetical protein
MKPSSVDRAKPTIRVFAVRFQNREHHAGLAEAQRERDGQTSIMLNWILQTLISAASAGIIAFVGFLFLVPTKVGNRAIGLWFDRRLEAFKGEQSKKIEKLKEQLSHLTDRGRLSNEREYAATAAAWESYVDAHYATLQSVAPFITSPDLAALSDEEINEFLRSNEFSDRQIADLRTAPDRNRGFARIVHLRLINKAGQALHDAREILIKQSVFMDKPLQDLFDQNLERLTRAWAEERTNFGGTDVAVELDQARGALIRNAPAWLDELRKKVRDRLLRSATPTA